MDERAGCAVLLGRFRAAGLEIQENHRLEDAGVVLDGYDPVRRIGYEYITTEAGDRAEMPPAVVAALEDRMEKGELYLFLIDEIDVDTEASLAAAADGFLEHLRKIGKLT